MTISSGNVIKIAKYWQEAAAKDKKTVESLFKSANYSYALFFAHLLLEKVLKSYVVLKIKDEAPRIHDLLRLANNSGLSFAQDELDFFNEMNKFNLGTRYPDYNFSIYKIATKEYTKRYLDKTFLVYKKLCRK